MIRFHKRCSFIAQAGRPGINKQNARFAARSLGFRPGLLKISLIVALVSGSFSFAQTTAPARSADVILAEIDAAHKQFNQVVKDPKDVSDPDRRKAIAPNAIPPLKTMVADFAELAQVQPKMKRRAEQIALQFNAYLSVLGDLPTIDHLQTMVASEDVPESLRGQSSQLLARWVLSGKDESVQTKLADEIQTLDQAHPESEDLTFLTVTVSQSTLSQPLEKRLLQLAKEMKNPVADKVRNATHKPGN